MRIRENSRRLKLINYSFPMDDDMPATRIKFILMLTIALILLPYAYPNVLWNRYLKKSLNDGPEVPIFALVLWPLVGILAIIIFGAIFNLDLNDKQIFFNKHFWVIFLTPISTTIGILSSILIVTIIRLPIIVFKFLKSYYSNSQFKRNRIANIIQKCKEPMIYFNEEEEAKRKEKEREAVNHELSLVGIKLKKK